MAGNVLAELDKFEATRQHLARDRASTSPASAWFYTVARESPATLDDEILQVLRAAAPRRLTSRELISQLRERTGRVVFLTELRARLRDLGGRRLVSEIGTDNYALPPGPLLLLTSPAFTVQRTLEPGVPVQVQLGAGPGARAPPREPTLLERERARLAPPPPAPPTQATLTPTVEQLATQAAVEKRKAFFEELLKKFGEAEPVKAGRAHTPPDELDERIARGEVGASLPEIKDLVLRFLRGTPENLAPLNGIQVGIRRTMDRRLLRVRIEAALRELEQEGKVEEFVPGVWKLRGA